MPWDKDEHPLGELDGEPVEKSKAKLAGAAVIGRRLDEGERVVLVVEGTAGTPAFNRADGQLTRVTPVKVEFIGEPAGDLGDEAEEFLRIIEESQTGEARLPLEGTDGKSAAAGERDDDAGDGEEVDR